MIGSRRMSPCALRIASSSDALKASSHHALRINSIPRSRLPDDEMRLAEADHAHRRQRLAVAVPLDHQPGIDIGRHRFFGAREQRLASRPVRVRIQECAELAEARIACPRR